MLASRVKPRGLFGVPFGMPQAPLQQQLPGPGQMPGQVPTPFPQQQPEPPPKPGFNGEGGWAEKLGAAGGLLLNIGGVQNNQFEQYQRTLQDRRQLKLQEQEYQRQRTDSMADWIAKQQYEAANVKPTNNDTVADYEFIRSNLGEEAAKLFLQNKADPPQYRQGPDGQFYRVDTSQGAAPTKPVGKLTPLGGAATPATPPFKGAVPIKLKNGIMTSGRRTPEGNRIVGGVPDSAHLRGDAVDYDGPNLPALLAEARQTLGPDKAFIHDGHVHVQKRGLNAPYYGKNGTRGLRKN